MEKNNFKKLTIKLTTITVLLLKSYKKLYILGDKVKSHSN